MGTGLAEKERRTPKRCRACHDQDHDKNLYPTKGVHKRDEDYTWSRNIYESSSQETTLYTAWLFEVSARIKHFQ
jgi:hypothetical protein